MERFELTVIAQGSQSVWVALLVIALLCVTVISLSVALWVLRLQRPVSRRKRRVRGYPRAFIA